MQSYDQSRTLIDQDRLLAIEECVKQTSALPGVMAEIGVYKGGSSSFIASLAPHKTLYSCDTFEGLPETDKSIDLHRKGDFNDVNYEEVLQYLKRQPNIQVIRGLFPDPLTHEVMYHYQFSFVHLDVDLYECTLNCLKFFHDRMAPGGIILSDDYKWQGCPGVEKAFHEFLADKSETLIDTHKLSCYYVKL